MTLKLAVLPCRIVWLATGWAEMFGVWLTVSTELLEVIDLVVLFRVLVTTTV